MRAAILAIVCLLLTICHAQAQTNAQSRHPESLKGLKGVALTIYFVRGDPLDTEQQNKVIKVLVDDATAKFSKASIPLFQTNQALQSAPGSPHLFVKIALNNPNGFPDNTTAGLPSIENDAWLIQKAHLSRDQSMEMTVSTWETHSTAFCDLNAAESFPATIEAIQQAIGTQVDQFIEAYKMANPK